ncbi:MAG: hypothetical protein R6V83_07430 [Candidatus Thorarchaeota archaeon]
MLPAEILVVVSLTTMAATIVGFFVSQLIAGFIELEWFGSKWTAIVLLGTSVSIYALPSGYIWFYHNSYFDDLIADFPIIMHNAMLAAILLISSIWISRRVAISRENAECE